MAVTKIWAIHDSLSRVTDYCSNPEKTKFTDLEQVLMYASDSKKTKEAGEKAFAVTGINCKAETAAQEMAAVQQRFGKEGGNVAYHAYQSFKPGEVTAEQCHRLGVELARNLWGSGYQVLVATHFNTGTFHNHFVINAVNMWTGKKLEAKFEVYYRMREESDRLCERDGLSVVEQPQKHKTPRAIHFAEKNGEPTNWNLMREALDEGLSIASDYRELRQILKLRGYALAASENRKYVTIRSFNSNKPVRTFRLGDKYTTEAMAVRMEQNVDVPELRYKFYGMIQHNAYMYQREHPPKPEYFRVRNFYREALRMSTIELIFRCLAIILGIEPIEPDRYQKPLSPECREAGRKLDRYTAMITLSGQEHFKDEDDVKRFITSTESEITRLTQTREKVRNKQRNVKEPEQKAQLKTECTHLTQGLERLRKRKKTAEWILAEYDNARELIRCECRSQVLNDPYISESEKQKLRGAATPQRNHER
ncbi:MAG: relaxase/mobilization nuclease domain-containing protein [Lachnospiraceae bacterium]|nr:relaxase/mobilization nuclease domain-containing protein [Lachnospiraceae bacterium]